MLDFILLWTGIILAALFIVAGIYVSITEEKTYEK